MLPTLLPLALFAASAAAQLSHSATFLRTIQRRADSTDTSADPETPSTTTDTDTCDPSHNGLATGTLQYVSDCNATTFCNSDGTCKPKECRRDEFPLGYPLSGIKANGFKLEAPDKCDKGKFCPDEGTGCQDQLAVGSACQLNRDDECQPPDNADELEDKSGFGLNVNGAICLNFVCHWANVTAGQECEVENVGYITYGANNSEFVDYVSRDNCVVGAYCDNSASPRVCVNRKLIAASCTADKECATFNCASGACAEAVNTPKHYGTWVYIVIGVCIFGGIFGILVALFFLHRRDRDAEREKRLQYWREQNAFRQNIMQMQESARASVFTASSRRGSAYGLQTEDSQAPMLKAEHKGSGLRYYVGSEDQHGGNGSYEDTTAENEGLVMRQPFNPDHKSPQPF
ncbi:hypothetical protein PENSPDRAFT_580767 [Peniophora sp. CONT]|nr:hypothetical protein PENSPDRAFT_580767 [Peniophora sp. CONT]